MIEKFSKDELSWEEMFDTLKIKYPDIPIDVIHILLGGGMPYDFKTGKFNYKEAWGRALPKLKKEKENLPKNTPKREKVTWMNPEEFDKKYYPNGRPVIVTLFPKKQKQQQEEREKNKRNDT